MPFIYRGHQEPVPKAGVDPGFQVRGAHLKKLLRVDGGACRVRSPWIRPCKGLEIIKQNEIS
jgi:hypothetical protein